MLRFISWNPETSDLDPIAGISAIHPDFVPCSLHTKNKTKQKNLLFT